MWSVSFFHNSNRIASGSTDATVKVWNYRGATGIQHTLGGHTKDVNSVSVSPDDKHIVSGSHDNTVRLWDVDGTQVVKVFNDHSAFVAAVVWLDAWTFASSSDDRTVRVWSLGSPPPVIHTRGVPIQVGCVCVCVCVLIHTQL